MNKNDLLKKLASRKFWITVAALVVAVCTAFGLGADKIAQISSVIGAFGVAAVYLFTQGKIDADEIKNQTPEDKSDGKS